MKAMVGVNVAAAVLCGAVMYAGTQHWQDQNEAQASEVKAAVVHKEKQFSDVSAYTKIFQTLLQNKLSHLSQIKSL